MKMRKKVSVLLVLLLVFPVVGMESSGSRIKKGVMRGVSAYGQGILEWIQANPISAGLTIINMFGLAFAYDYWQRQCYPVEVRKSQGWVDAQMLVKPSFINGEVELAIGSRKLLIANYHRAVVATRRNVFLNYAVYDERELENDINTLEIINKKASSGAVAVIYQKGLKNPRIRNIITSAQQEQLVADAKLLHVFMGLNYDSSRCSVLVAPAKDSYVINAAFEHEIYLPVGHPMKITYETSQGIEQIIE